MTQVQKGLSMVKQKIFSILASGIFIAGSIAVLPTLAQRPGQFAEILQGTLREESEAQSTNTAKAWHSVGQAWMSQGGSMAINENHQDWVKDSLNPAAHDISVAALKRSIACFVKSYDLEGVHDTPQSRARSDALRGLSSAYLQLIKIDPRNSSWYYLYGEAQTAQGLYKQATPYLKKAVALGGDGGSKASALIAHSQTYLAHQLANDQALWNHNEAVDKYNAAHYKPPVYRHGYNASDLYIRTRDYQASHPNAQPGEHY
jgi:tetratricopeptide (TPR) repeat protein